MESLPTRELKIYPGSLSTYDGNKPGQPVVFDASGMWFYPAGPATPYLAPNGSGAARYLLLDPRYTDAAGRAGQDEWWFVINRYWPSDYAPDTNDRDPNWHNAPGDAGSSPGAPGGIGWAPNFGSGVSALAFDYLKDTKTWNICVLCAWRSEGGFDFAVPFERDAWNTTIIHWIAGRNDGSTVRPGLVQVWQNGRDTPILDRKGINTVQRAKSPADGQFYVQRWMTFWEGAYTIKIQNTPYRKVIATTRMGRTLAEALAERPTFPKSNAESIFRAYGSYPLSSYAIPQPEFDVALTKVPPSLAGGPQPEPEPQPPEVTSSIKGGDTVPFGTRWSVTAPTSERTELWADGARLAETAGESVGVDLVALAAGEHAIGIAVTYKGVRKTLGSGGIYGRITVEAKPEPEPGDLNVHVVGTPTAKAVTLGWNVLPEQDGYLLLLDGKEVWPDGKRHASMSETTGQTRVGRPQDGKPHVYGVRILGSVKEGEVTV